MQFLKDLPGDRYLLVVMDLFEGLRSDEMVKLTVDDIEDKGVIVIVVKIKETKTGKAKSFTIVEEKQLGV